MNTLIHEFASPQDGPGIWRQANPEAIDVNIGEEITADRRRDDMTGDDQAQDRSLLRLLHELVNCLPAPAEVEALRIWFHSLREHPVRWLLLMDGLSTEVRMGTELSLEDSIINWVWQYQRPLIIAAEEETRFPDFVRRLLESGIKYFCAAPLMLADRLIGILGLGSISREALLGLDFKFIPHGAANGAGVTRKAGLYQSPSDTQMISRCEAICPEKDGASGNDFEGIIGRSATIGALCQQIKVVAPTGSTVLILGETGTGKELLARAVHNVSPRLGRPFIKVNCAAIPAGLIESELFGHERGAFTGAVTRRAGRFEMANGGTLFLDEIGDIPLELQPKLLRVLQEQEFERVGSTQTTQVDVRIIAATSRNLPQMVAAREFRADLYYRLNVFPVSVPALRERAEDVPLLVRHFVDLYSRRASKRITEVPAETMAALLRYPWPGNVRELQNIIERAVILSPGKVLQVALNELQGSSEIYDGVCGGKNNSRMTLKDIEREHIIQALAETNWVVGGPKGAAARIGLARSSLIAKMQKLGITRALA
jgi:formate hydrogenlyase transcriptional activator